MEPVLSKKAPVGPLVLILATETTRAAPSAGLLPCMRLTLVAVMPGQQAFTLMPSRCSAFASRTVAALSAVFETG